LLDEAEAKRTFEYLKQMGELEELSQSGTGQAPAPLSD
jgi:hypothetical protein